MMVLAANALIIILSFATNILVTHSMATEDYGYYKAFVNSMTTLTTFCSLGFSLSFSRMYATASDSHEKKKLAGIAYIINITISILLFMVLLAARGLMSLVSIEIPTYLVFASGFVWVTLLERFYLHKFQGENRISSYSLFTFVPKFILAIFFFISFLTEWTLSPTIAISFYLVSTLSVMLFTFLKEPPSFRLNIQDIKTILSSNKSYGFQIYIGSLASVASAQVLNLLVASISNLSEYAVFALGTSLATPIMQIPSIMGTISFKRNVHSGKLSKAQISTTLIMTLLSIIAYTLFLNFVLKFLLGTDYHGALTYASIMIYYYAFMGLGDYFNRFIIAKGEGKAVRNSSFIVGAALIASAAILIPFLKVSGVIIAETISGLIYLFNMVFIYVKITKRLKNTPDGVEAMVTESNDVINK